MPWGEDLVLVAEAVADRQTATDPEGTSDWHAGKPFGRSVMGLTDGFSLYEDQPSYGAKPRVRQINRLAGDILVRRARKKGVKNDATASA